MWKILIWQLHVVVRAGQLGEPVQGRPWWRGPGRDPLKPGATERLGQDQPTVSNHWSQVTQPSFPPPPPPPPLFFLRWLLPNQFGGILLHQLCLFLLLASVPGMFNFKPRNLQHDSEEHQFSALSGRLVHFTHLKWIDLEQRSSRLPWCWTTWLWLGAWMCRCFCTKFPQI